MHGNKSQTENSSVPASTTTMANHSQSPLPPLATADADAVEEVRLWDRDWSIPGSTVVGLGEGLGLERDNQTGQRVTTGRTGDGWPLRQMAGAKKAR